MLTKLLKYEFRASFRELLPLYVALVGVAALVRPAYFRGIDNELTGITMMVYSALMIAIVVISILTIVQRFTRTMLGREAYLMLTLPVPVSVHVAAKLIVGVTVMIAGVLVATLSFFVMTVNSSMLILLKYFLQEAAQLLEALLRQNAYVLLAEFVLVWVMLLVEGLLLRAIEPACRLRTLEHHMFEVVSQTGVLGRVVDCSDIESNHTVYIGLRLVFPDVYRSTVAQLECAQPLGISQQARRKKRQQYYNQRESSCFHLV